MAYTPPNLTIDTDSLYENAVAMYQDSYPLFEPDETSRVAIILSAAANMAYEQAFVMAQQFDNIYLDFGQELYGIQPQTGTFAEAATTWNATDSVGYTVEAGTEIVIDDIGFAVVDEVVIPPGSTSTGLGEVLVRALEVGEDANGLGDMAATVSSISWVSNVQVVGTSAGGSEPETTEQFRVRLTEELTTVSPTAVTADDLLKFARRVPGVYRAIVLDAYRMANLLTLNQASLEDNNTTGYAVQTNVAIASSNAQAASGTYSLRLTSVAAGDMVARTLNSTNAVPVAPGGLYTARAEFRAAVSARSVAVGIEWLDTAGASLGAVTYGSTVTDATSSWTLASYASTAPPTANYAVIYLKVVATGGASEQHFADKVAFNNEWDTTWYGASPNVLDPETNTYGNAGHITVTTVDEDGNPGPRDDVLEDLNNRRMTGITIHYLDAIYTTVNITTTIVVDTTRFTAAEVIAAVETALEEYASPQRSGLDATSEDTEIADEGAWVPDPYLRRDEVFAVIHTVPGVRYVDTLTINGNSTTNVLMAGAIALPRPGTFLVSDA